MFVCHAVGTAVGKLLTLGGIGIWWIVDIILLVLGELRPADDSNWVPYYWLTAAASSSLPVTLAEWWHWCDTCHVVEDHVMTPEEALADHRPPTWLSIRVCQCAVSTCTSHYQLLLLSLKPNQCVHLWQDEDLRCCQRWMTTVTLLAGTTVVILETGVLVSRRLETRFSKSSQSLLVVFWSKS